MFLAGCPVDRHAATVAAIRTRERARNVGAIIARRGLTQVAAAEVLEIDQPKVSALTRGRLAGLEAGFTSFAPARP